MIFFQAFADENIQNDIDYIDKTASLNDNENEITITIETNYKKQNIKTLVYQGTYCSAHGLKDQTIISMLQTLTNNGDIDYYADATHYSKGTRIKNELKHFNKGDTISLSDIYKTTSDSGIHIISQKSLDDLMSLLETGEYDYLVMILDGSFATGLSAGTKDEIFNVKKSLLLTDQEYLDRMEYSKILANMPILYFTSPLQGNDTKITWDNYSATSYTTVRDYWDDSNYNGTNNSTRTSLRYLNAHLFVEGLAFLAPEYYLTLIDDTTGKPNIDIPPTADEIEYKYDNFVTYNDLANIVDKLKKTEDYFLPTKITINDTLTDGLSYISGKVQYYDENTSEWKDIIPDDKVDVEIKENDQTITATISDSETIYSGKKLRFTINALPSEDFGINGEPIKTNKNCDITYENNENKIISEQDKESPDVKFTLANIYYDEGEHGVLTGIPSETFKLANRNIVSGSSVNTDPNYNHTGWICDKDVLLRDGITINQGILLTNEQIKNVVAIDNLTFTAQYELIKNDDNDDDDDDNDDNNNGEIYNEEVNNPETRDNVMTYLAIFVLSIIGMAGTVVKLLADLRTLLKQDDK